MEAPHGSYGDRRRAAILVIAVAAVLFVPTLFVRGLWAPDEPRYAAVAWDMAHRGDLLVPRINGELYDQKPPLFFYLAAAADLLAPMRGGRIVEALAMALAALLVPAFLAPSERKAAFLAPLVFLTTVIGLELGKFGIIDGVLLLFLTLGVLLGRRAMASSRPVGPWIGCFVALGLGTLVKGPQIVPFVLLALVGSLADLPRPASRRAHLTGIGLGVLLYLAIALAWLIPACLAGGQGYSTELIGQLWKRITGERESHNRPWHYYFAMLPAMFLPWTLLFLAALPRAFRRLRANLWLLCWIVGGFVMLTVLASKRERYLSLFLPACAVLIARHLATVDFDRVGKIALRVTAAVLGATGLTVAAAAGIVWAVARIPAERLPYGTTEILEGFSAYALWAIAPLLGLAVMTGAWIAWRRAEIGPPSAAAGGILLCGVALSLAFDLVLTPAVDPVKAGNRIIAKIVEWSDRGVEIGAFGNDFDGRINMFLRRERIEVYDDNPSAEHPSPDPALAAEKPVAILFSSRKRRETDELPSRPGCTVLAVGSLGGSQVVLIGNRAAVALAPDAVYTPPEKPR